MILTLAFSITSYGKTLVVRRPVDSHWRRWCVWRLAE